MQLRRLIASGLLLAVFMAPAMGFALVCGAGIHAQPACPLCTGMSHMTMHPGHARMPAQTPPCCQKRAPMPAQAEASAPPVTPVQLGWLPATSLEAAPGSLPASRALQALSPPSAAPPLELLCTLRI